jgi:hypothetical protein
VLDGGARRVAGVVPAFEGGDEYGLHELVLVA